MIQGYRMAGPPPHGEPPQASHQEREWPWWLGFAGLGAVAIVSIVSAGLIYSIAGVGPDEDSPAGVDLAASLALQGSLIAAAMIGAFLVKPLHPWQFGLRATRFWPAVGWALLAMVGFYLAAALYVAVAGEPDQSTAEDIGANDSQLALIGAGVMFVFIAPVAEELFFRGFFYGSLRTKFPTVLAALIGGTVFGLIHASTGLSAVPILIVLGIILCLVREKTGSLYPCIGIHALNNTFAYAGQTDVALGIALAFGATMLAACCLVSRFLWREAPAPA